MLPVLTLGREGGGAEVAQELNNLEERKSHETTKIKKKVFFGKRGNEMICDEMICAPLRVFSRVL